MALAAMHAAATGMKALDTKLNVVANNLANINTVGFKKSRVNFEDLLYQTMDSSAYYRGHADPESRSQMNVAFNLPTPELEAKFISEAAAHGLKGLKGHRSIGGCRASIYNAFALEGVVKLTDFMKHFADENPA